MLCVGCSRCAFFHFFSCVTLLGNFHSSYFIQFSCGPGEERKKEKQQSEENSDSLFLLFFFHFRLCFSQLFSHCFQPNSLLIQWDKWVESIFSHFFDVMARAIMESGCAMMPIKVRRRNNDDVFFSSNFFLIACCLNSWQISRWWRSAHTKRSNNNAWSSINWLCTKTANESGQASESEKYCPKNEGNLKFHFHFPHQLLLYIHWVVSFTFVAAVADVFGRRFS